MPLRLVLTNVTKDTVELSTYGMREQRVDFVVMHGRREVWEKLRGSTMLDIALSARIASGDSLVFQDRWNGRTNHRHLVSPGIYTVRASLPGSEIRSGSVAFRIR